MSAHASTCAAYEFVAARGSGDDPDTDYSASQHYGMGGLLYNVYKRLSDPATGLGEDVTPYGVRFPAVGLMKNVSEWLNAGGAALHLGGLGAYTDSVKTGTKDAIAEIERVRKGTCGATTRIILAGYSQGAQATADALQRMPQNDRDMVAAALFYGDPYFNATSFADRGTFDPGHYGALGVRDEYPSDFEGRVFSYCHKYDPICNLSVKKHILGTSYDVYVRDVPMLVKHGFGAHTNYDSASVGDDARGAQDILNALGHKSPAPPSTNTPLDLVFVIDTTGSMGGVIGTVKSDVGALADALAETTSDYRFALVDYKDYVDAYQSRLDVPFTSDLNALKDGLSALSAAGGGDYPESAYSGAMTALEQPFRDGIKKAILVIGDAPPHDPEPVTGYTASDVINKALSIDPAQIYTEQIGSDPAVADYFGKLSDGTAGVFAAANASSSLTQSLIDLLTKAGQAPAARISTPDTATTGAPVPLSGAASTSPLGPITKYEWDFDADGTYDTSSTSPVVEHTFATDGPHDVVLRVTDSVGLTSLATATVVTTPAPAEPPASVSGLSGFGSAGSAQLMWNNGSGAPPSYYVIRDGVGNVLDVLSPTSDGTPPAYVIGDLSDGQAYDFTVTAGNERGESEPVGIEVIAGGGSPRAVTPGVPTNFKAVPGDRQVVLSWSAPVDRFGPVTDYNVYVSSDAGKNWKVATLQYHEPTATTQTAIGLTNGTGYLFKVAAVRQGLTSDYVSLAAPVTPTATVATPAPVPNPSGSPAPEPTPSASPTAVPSSGPTGSPSPSMAAPQLTVSRGLITAGQSVAATVVGTPGDHVELMAIDPQATTGRVVRTGVLPESGSLTWSDLRPVISTDLQVRSQDSALASSQRAVAVRKALTLRATRTSRLHYALNGRVSPGRSNVPVAVFLVLASGKLQQVTTVRTDSHGAWSLPVTYSTAGNHTYEVRSGADQLNAAAQSVRLRVTAS